MVDGSTWGLAGLRFRRINFVFFAGGSPFSAAVVVVRAVSGFTVDVRAVAVDVSAASSGEAERFRDGEVEGGASVVRAWTTSAMVDKVFSSVLSEEQDLGELSQI